MIGVLVSSAIIGLGSLIFPGGAGAAIATGSIASWGPEVHHVVGTFNGNSITALQEMANITLSDNSSFRAYCIDLGTGTTTGNAYDEATWQTAHPQSDLGRILWAEPVKGFETTFFYLFCMSASRDRSLIQAARDESETPPTNATKTPVSS